MLAKFLTLPLAATIAATLFSSTADAGERFVYRRAAPYDRYYAGPRFVQEVPGLRVFFGDYAMSEEEFNALYGDDRRFDESYYEPEVVAPAKARKKAVGKTAAKPAPAATRSASAEPVTEAPAKSSGVTKTATPASAGKSASATVNCDRAQSIIAGYGFSGVKAESCTGKIYAFNATRDGRNFAIKLDPRNGELTEVKKLN